MAFPRVYVAGTFDLPHVGHIRLFKRARALGHLTVAVNPDEFAERYKRKPILPLADRMEIVGACRYVDDVIENWGCEDSKPAILSVRPQFIVHGDDWSREGFLNIMGISEEFLSIHGIRVIPVPYTPGISTSSIIEAHPW